MGEGRRRVFSGNPLETRYGYCRAVRAGNSIHVSGTVAVWPGGECDPDPGVQTRRCLEIIARALAELGASPGDVVRTRMFVTSAEYSEPVGLAHAEFFADAQPATTMVIVGGLLDPRWKVEIEADAYCVPARANDGESRLE